jgi:uncharacterized protein (TIGR02266 family)
VPAKPRKAPSERRSSPQAAPSERRSTPEADPSERRSSPRVDLDVAITLESDHNFYTGLTQDISTGGLFVATHHLRRVGERITVSFTLPGRNEPIAMETEVRWIRSFPGAGADVPVGMGLRFVNLSSEAKFAIASFLRHRDSLFYDDE